jgi:hypothetical protein
LTRPSPLARAIAEEWLPDWQPSEATDREDIAAGRSELAALIDAKLGPVRILPCLCDQPREDQTPGRHKPVRRNRCAGESRHRIHHAGGRRMTVFLPHNLPHNLAADQWRQDASRVRREDIGPNAEAWLRDRIPAYREARERMERPALAE